MSSAVLIRCSAGATSFALQIGQVGLLGESIFRFMRLVLFPSQNQPDGHACRPRAGAPLGGASVRIGGRASLISFLLFFLFFLFFLCLFFS